MVHPKTAKMYSDAGIEPRPTTEDLVKARFESETRGKPRKYRIDQIYRVKQIDRDYIVYNQTVFSEDFPGNARTFSETVGYHDEPVFQMAYDETTGQPKAQNVQGTNRVYDIPATKANIMKILKGPDVIATNTSFVIQDSSMKYGGFSVDEFSQRHFDDLLHKATKGDYPEKLKSFEEEEKEEEGVREPETKGGAGGGGKVKQLKKDLISSEDVPEGGKELELMREAERKPPQERREEQIKREVKKGGGEEKEEEEQEKERNRRRDAEEKQRREAATEKQEEQEREQQQQPESGPGFGSKPAKEQKTTKQSKRRV